MNREVLKKNYFNTLEEDKLNKYSQGYEAHHIAILNDEFMDNGENCIMLKGNHDDLINSNEYLKWFAKKTDNLDLQTITDIKVICLILKPIKKMVKDLSEDRDKNKIISKITNGNL